MTTIASPRPSITLSSRRTSTSTDTTIRSEAHNKPGPGQQRRNRAALREFYGLKDESKANSVDSSETIPGEEAATEDAIDQQGFSVDHYVEDVLGKQGLEGALRIEAGLLRDIRGLDGEKKALVYDNYSKLIGATDTIRKVTFARAASWATSDGSSRCVGTWPP